METPTKFFHNFEDKLKVFAKKLGNVLIVTISLIIGFFIGYYYWLLTNKPVHESPLTKIKKIEMTSIAINERNELMIIDRADGTYEVYQDSIGLAIFNLFANKKYQEVTTK